MKKLTGPEKRHLEREFNCFDVEVFLRTSGAITAGCLGIAFIVEAMRRNNAFAGLSLGGILCVILAMFLLGSLFVLILGWFGDAIGFTIACARTRYVAYKLGLTKEERLKRSKRRKQNLPIIFRFFLQQ